MGMRYCSAKFEKSSKCKVRVMLQLPHVKFHTAMRQSLCSSGGISLHLFPPVASCSNLNTVTLKKKSETACQFHKTNNINHKTWRTKTNTSAGVFFGSAQQTVTWAHYEEYNSWTKSPYCISACLWLLCRHVACALGGGGGAGGRNAFRVRGRTAMCTCTAVTLATGVVQEPQSFRVKLHLHSTFLSFSFCFLELDISTFHLLLFVAPTFGQRIWKHFLFFF